MCKLFNIDEKAVAHVVKLGLELPARFRNADARAELLVDGLVRYSDDYTAPLLVVRYRSASQRESQSGRVQTRCCDTNLNM